MLAWTKQNTIQRAMRTVLEWPQSHATRKTINMITNKHYFYAILCFSTYHDIPRQAIPYTMRCPPGHTIYHAMPVRPYNILCQAPCLACQAITIYHAMPARPYHIPCDARQAILYHAMPARPYHIPCMARQAIP